MSDIRVPEIVKRILKYSGKSRNEVRNPCLTANEVIELANWIKRNTTTVEYSSWTVNPRPPRNTKPSPPMLVKVENNQ